jgi:hypothetical protein
MGEVDFDADADAGLRFKRFSTMRGNVEIVVHLAVAGRAA